MHAGILWRKLAELRSQTPEGGALATYIFQSSISQTDTHAHTQTRGHIVLSAGLTPGLVMLAYNHHIAAPVHAILRSCRLRWACQ